MAATAAIIGKGTNIGYATTSGGSYTLIGEVANVGQPEISVGSTPATHYTSDSDWEEKLSSVWKDAADLPLLINYVKGQTTTLYGLIGVARWFKITKPDSSTYVFPGFISKLGGGDIPIKEAIKQAITITPTGPVTYTAGA